MLWKRLNKDNTPIFMSRRLRAGDSAYHDLPVINLLSRKAMTHEEEKERDQLCGTPLLLRLHEEVVAGAMNTPRTDEGLKATGSSTATKWKRVL